MAKIKHFPRHLFFRFITGQLILLIPVYAILAIFANITIKHNSAQLANSSPEFLATFDKTFLLFSAGLLFAFVGTSIWMAYRLILPLGRIIVKARTILRREQMHDDEEKTNLLEDGEWSDLESALNKIHTDIHRQDQFLARDQIEMETILGAISDAVLAIDKNGQILFFNNQFTFSFATQDILKRKPTLTELFRAPEILAAFQKTLHEQKSYTNDVSLHVNGSQNHRFFSVTITPLLQKENSQIYGAVGVFHDVTEIKHTEQVRIDFVANVSHELRTPLTSIKGYAETLKIDLEKSSTVSSDLKYIDIILRNTNRLVDLVNDLLNLSSLESGGDLEKNKIPLKEITERALQQLENKRAQKNIQIFQNYSLENLMADEKRVEQIIFNLVENAIKYIPSEGSIWIEWQKNEENIELHIKDNGPGIPSEYHNRLFERFYRVDKARSRDQGGTGLGLSIVKHIMQRHTGNVRVLSGLGKGTEFICSFPANSSRVN